MWNQKVLKAVIFDLDDTLLTSQIDFSEMKIKMIEYLERRLPLPVELNKNRLTYEIIQYAVESLNELGLCDCIPKVVRELDGIMSETEMKYVFNAQLIDGATQTLGRIKSVGMRIGILTRSCRKYADEVLKTTGLSTFVDVVAARDDCENPKPDPSQVYWLMDKMGVESDQVLMIGDHPTDLVCARNAGIAFVGVLTSAWSSGQLNQLGPTVVSSVKELPRLLNL